MRLGWPARPQLVRNDPAVYERLAGQWWDPDGPFAMLHWLAAARAELIPAARAPAAVLVDLGCGAGLLAPHVAARGYRHIGVDASGSALDAARAHGVAAVRGDVLAVPLAAASADVVVAGEILEHVTDLARAVREACRVLRPGGLLVIDTLAATALSKFIAVTLGERVAGGAPRGIHDPALFVNRAALVAECARHGVTLRLRGLRPAIGDLIGWWSGKRQDVRLLPAASTVVLFQGAGVKSPAVTAQSREARR